MTHYMKLNPQPFDLMASGIKTIELRLNDEKRQNLKIGDIIVFSKVSNPIEQITVRIIKLHKFCDFDALYKALPLEKCGYSPEQAAAASPKDMEAYYSLAQQSEYGVLGIEIALIQSDGSNL